MANMIPLIKSGGFYASRYWTPLVIGNGLTTTGGDTPDPPVQKTVSGSIVHITDALAAPAVDLSVAINLVQSGSGDPSPDNVRPIMGWTGLNLMKTGANIWGGNALAESFRGAYGFTKNESTKTITFQRASTSPYHHTLCKLPFKENTRYTLIFRYSNSANNNSIRVTYTNGTYDSFSLRNSSGEKTTASITSSSSKTISEIWLGYTDIALTTVYYEESGLFEGSITGEDFEAYNSENFKYAFNGHQEPFAPTQSGSGYPAPTNVRTIVPGLSFVRDDNTTLVVYGGTFEINADGTGTITETIAGRYASEITWTQNQSNTHTFNGEGFTDRLLRIDADDRSDCFCDSYRWYKSTDVASQSSGAALANSNSGTLAARSRIYLSDDRFNGVAAFTASFSTHDPLFVLPLETAVTYSLTATEVSRVCLALGLNYADTGTVYGGTLDVTTGELTVTHRYMVADGVNVKTTGGYGAAGPKWLPCIVLSASDYAVWDTMKTSYLRTPLPNFDVQTVENTANFGNSAHVIILHIGTMQGTDGTHGYNSANEVHAAVNAYLQSNPLQICYELATHLTYTLTPTEVQMLLGTNNVWSDTGDTTLTYLADGNVSASSALNMLLGGTYTPSADVSDREALQIIMGDTT